MNSVPLPVRLGWYAWRFAATTAEIQMRMTHAMIVTLREARPLAPADWREVSKFKANSPQSPETAAAETTAPEPKAPSKAPDMAIAKVAPAKPRQGAASVRGQSKTKGKASTGARARRIPSAPPPMPNGRIEG